jgi:hypothetical protein
MTAFYFWKLILNHCSNLIMFINRTNNMSKAFRRIKACLSCSIRHCSGITLLLTPPTDIHWKDLISVVRLLIKFVVLFIIIFKLLQSSRWVPVHRPKTSKTLFRPVTVSVFFLELYIKITSMNSISIKNWIG